MGEEGLYRVRGQRTHTRHGIRSFSEHAGRVGLTRDLGSSSIRELSEGSEEFVDLRFGARRWRGSVRSVERRRFSVTRCRMPTMSARAPSCQTSSGFACGLKAVEAAESACAHAASGMVRSRRRSARSAPLPGRSRRPLHETLGEASTLPHKP